MTDSLHIRLLRLVLRLYPLRFRERHGAEILGNARMAAQTRGAGAPVWIVVDAVFTLWRVWLHRVARRIASFSLSGTVAALARDALLGLRALRRRPLQGVVIVLTLAIALGANSAIYTIAYELLLDRLPYDSPERIVEVRRGPTRMVPAGDGMSWRVARALIDHPGVEAAATYYPDAGANLVADQETSRVRMTQVSSAFFDVLGVRMLLGRGSDVEGERDAVLGFGLWRSAFGGDPEIIGRIIHLSGHSYRVVGVAPQGVEFPAGTQMWIADPPVDEFFGSAYGPEVVARLRPGFFASVQRALIEDAELRRADAGDAAQYISDPELIPLRSYLTSEVRMPLIILTGAAAALLLLGCVNVAGMSIARVAARAPELAMRRALGAGRIRLFGQLLAELAVLALLAGVLSTLVAAAAVPVLVSMLPAGTPGLNAVRPGAWTLIFTGAATAVAALVVGVPPALAGARGGGGSVHPDRLRSDDRGGERVQAILTSVQVAVAVMLVVTASLLGKSLAAQRAVPLGFSTENVLTFSVRLPRATYAKGSDMRRYLEDVRARLAELPGVQAVSVSDRLPLGDGMGVGGRVYRAGTPLEGAITASQYAVSREFFATLGIGLRGGRTFTGEDDPEATVILSRELAIRLFGDSSAIGSQVTVRRPLGPHEAVVIGVAEDIRARGIGEDPRPTVYFPLESVVTRSPGFAVRTSASPAVTIAGVRRVVAEVDPTVAPHALRMTRDAASEMLAASRATAVIALLFGSASLLLALMAVYALLTHGVVRRRREMGIRLALGATARQIETLVVARGMVWTLGGVAAGVLLSLAATRVLEGMLFGVAPRDPQVLVSTALAVLAAAALASWLPARRAARLDALVSLREE